MEAVSGASYVVRGFTLWRRRPGLMVLGMVPALIVLAFFLAALITLVVELGRITDALTFFADDWSSTVRSLVRVLLGLVILVGAVLLASVTFTGLTLAVGDPFYERIWRETELMLGGEVPEGELGFLRSLREGAVIAVVGLATSLGVVLIGFVPVIGTVVGAVLGLAISGRLLALELLARPLEARGLDHEARRALLRPHQPQVVGFGVATQLCFLVPLGAVVVMPAAVVGATMLARDLLAPGGPVSGPVSGPPGGPVSGPVSDPTR